MKLVSDVSGLKGDMIGQVVTIGDGEFSVTGRLTSIHVWSSPAAVNGFGHTPIRFVLHATVGVEGREFDVSPFTSVIWEEE